MRPIKTLEQILAGSTDIRMVDMIALAESFGFELDRVKKGHHIFLHPQVERLISLQSVRSKANPYQTQQFLRLVEEHDLSPADDA